MSATREMPRVSFRARRSTRARYAKGVVLTKGASAPTGEVGFRVARYSSSYSTITVVGQEATPLATTSKVLRPRS